MAVTSAQTLRLENSSVRAQPERQPILKQTLARYASNFIGGLLTRFKLPNQAANEAVRSAMNRCRNDPRQTWARRPPLLNRDRITIPRRVKRILRGFGGSESV